MNTEITTRHFELSESLRQRVEDRLSKLQRYFDRIMGARVVVSFERNRYHAEASITANGTPLVSHAVADSDKGAFEQVIDKLEVQLRRHKDRLTRQKRRRGGEVLPIGPEPEAMETPADEEAALGFDASDFDGLVSDDAGEFDVEMTAAEAAAQLRVSRREVLGFTNSATQRPTIVFKRRDGHVGVVDIHLE
jgi:putative sigma-54 modulation protein